MDKNDFYVGQELYFVPEDTRRDKKFVKVTKVGHKYVMLDDDSRIEIGFTSVTDKIYGYQGKFYFSEKNYIDFNNAKETKIKINNLLDQLVFDLSNDSHIDYLKQIQQELADRLNRK